MNHILAQSLTIPWTNGPAKINGPLQGGPLGTNPSLGAILSRAITFVFIFAGFGLFIMLLAGGFTFLTSAGDPKQLEKGQQQLTNALLGFLIIFVAYWLVQALGIIFGVDAIKNIFG
ncbi:MAG TPA: hypothetical protein VMR81_02095 [Patescibacteria group bacterium]|jgi:cytosine/uracil/thiamine/allantoin permease|nr:hypothetical protein [Patescibacteria group bacterium]